VPYGIVLVRARRSRDRRSWAKQPLIRSNLRSILLIGVRGARSEQCGVWSKGVMLEISAEKDEKSRGLKRTTKTQERSTTNQYRHHDLEAVYNWQ